MPAKHFDLDIDTNLGGENASHQYIASQKAVKEYVDARVSGLTFVEGDGIKIENGVISAPRKAQVLIKDWIEE